jgi:hypothetical protein
MRLTEFSMQAGCILETNMIPKAHCRRPPTVRMSKMRLQMNCPASRTSDRSCSSQSGLTPHAVSSILPRRTCFRRRRASQSLTDTVLFFKTAPPVDPSSFVTSFCKHIAGNSGRRQTRSVRRLTPVTLTGKASESGIDEIARKVLASHFHSDDIPPKKVS